jgi:NADH dehydrogenase [ubiquinone] 1 alpha subcomplex assembly factor 2
MRRIVQYPSSTHYSEIKISPQWHQWLRHTRYDPPSLIEQSQDLIRQENLKVLAAKADERWAAKPSFLDKPGTERGQPVPALEVDGVPKLETEAMEGPVKSAVGGLEDQTTGTEAGSAVKAAEENETTPPRSNEQFEQNKRQKMPQKNEKDNPWKQARGGPSEEWQPQAWDGNMAAARRR